MTLPNGSQAIIDLSKITDYCLSLTHLRGRHKARVFKSVLGMTAEHAAELRTALALAARESDATIGSSDAYGTRYIIDFELQRNELSGMIRSRWILRSGESAPRFVTCYVL